MNNENLQEKKKHVYFTLHSKLFTLRQLVTQRIIILKL